MGIYFSYFPDSCCWLNFKKNHDADLDLNSLEGIDNVTESSVQVPASDIELSGQVCTHRGQINWLRKKWKKLQSELWSLLEEPQSSSTAQVSEF